VPPAADAQSWQEQAPLGEAVRLARHHLGLAYAGAVIDDESRTLTIYATPPFPEATSLEAIAKNLFAIRVVPVARTLQELKHIQSLIDDLMHSPDGRTIGGTHLKLDTNQVHVDVDPDDPADLPTRILSLAPPGSIDVARRYVRFR
jgi:hypothetical protein